jgi:acyl-CoA synthetase (AMP-forming)/AMP-acid ligase II/acyl carrier protein
MTSVSNAFPSPVPPLPTLVDLLRWRAAHQPDQASYHFLLDGELQEDSLTYADLYRRAQEIATQLQILIAGGERVLLLYPPGLEYIAAFWGCLYAGVVAVPAYPPRHDEALAWLEALATDAQAKVALTTTGIRSRLVVPSTQYPHLAKLHWVTPEDSPEPTLLDWRQPELTGDSLALLQYTSGSTGSPKGVLLTHRNLLHNSGLISHTFALTAQSKGVIWLPPYHDMGLIGGILQPLYVGFPCILMTPGSFLQRPFRWLQAISHYGGTCSGGPNFAYDLCVRRISPEQRASLDLSRWEVAFTGAEPIRRETLELFADAFEPSGFRREAFFPCYGLAEGTLIVSGGTKSALPAMDLIDGAALAQHQVVPASPSDRDARPFVSCGQTLQDQKIVIADPATLARCASDRIGEIWVAGPSVAQGYWNRSDATAHSFRAYLSDTGEGPFLRTGDLGYLKEGELFVTGRLKDLIIINGRNYYPQDIERTIEKCHPSLRPASSAAFTADVAGQERLVVVTEVDRLHRRQRQWAPGENGSDLSPATGIDADAITAAIRRTVSYHHGLQVDAIWLLKTGSLPKTSSGKTKRHACRTGFLNGTLNALATWSRRSAIDEAGDFVAPRTPVEEVLAGISAQLLGLPRVSVLDSFYDIGGHSLLATQLISRVREVFQVELPLRSTFHAQTVAELANVLLQVPSQQLRVEQTARVLLHVAQLSDTEVESMLQQRASLAD